MVAQVSYDEFNEDRNLVSINRGKACLILILAGASHLLNGIAGAL